MGMFDTISSAASAAAKPLDTASNLLAGNLGSPAGAAGKPGDPEWWKGYNLDVDQSDKESAGQAPNLENALNSYPVIEFIHFGFVHTSHSNFFAHDDLSDVDKDKPNNKKVKAGDRPRAVQFRSALEREALLLWLFMQSTEAVLKKREDESGMGGLGSVLDTAGSLFGAGGGGSGKTQSSDLVSHENKVVAAIKPVLGDSVVYKDIHKAGIDLNQARADYRALLKKLVDEKPAAGAGGIAGTLMSQATSLPGSLMGGAAAAAGGGKPDSGGGVAGTLGSVVSFTQGVAFKAQDIKAKFFVLTALQQEPQIEASSNEMTYQGINQTMNPFLPVWFDPAPAKDADKWAGPDDPLNSAGGNMLGFAKSYVQKADDDVRSSVKDKGNEVKGFFEKAPDNPPPGTEALGMAFNDPPKHQGAKSIIPMKMGDVACQAFIKTLDLPPQLGFAETVVSGIMGVALEFTQAIYQALLVRDETKAIEEADLVKSASEDLKLAERLEAIALDKLSFLKTAKEWDTGSLTGGLPLANGFKVNPGDLLDKGADKLDEIIAEKVTPLLDPIIKYAMADLAATLETCRQCGVTDKCHTMEWYLGKLPTIQTTLFCNLFFPFWNAMMRAGADLIGGPVGSAIKGILDVAEKMKGAVDTVRGVATKVGAYATAADKTAGRLADMKSDTIGTQVKDTMTDFNTAKNSKASDVKKSPEAQKVLSDYPLKGRSDMGQGVKISLDDYKKVEPDFKWKDAKDPAQTGDDAAAAPTSAAPSPTVAGAAK